jgi:hypothetical protein
MQLAGVDVDHGNNISAVHGDDEAERLVAAFGATLDRMRAERLVAAA